MIHSFIESPAHSIIAIQGLNMKFYVEELNMKFVSIGCIALLGLTACQMQRPMMWTKLDGSRLPPIEIPSARQMELQCKANAMQAGSTVPSAPGTFVMSNGLAIPVDANNQYRNDLTLANYEACMARAGYLRRPATDAEIEEQRKGT
jgi:hypothetical protein